MATYIQRDLYGNPVERTVLNSTNAYTSNDFFIDKISGVLAFITGLIEFFLITRIIFLLIGANNVGFVKFIYDVSNYFMSPFNGVFRYSFPQVIGTYVDWIAIIVAIIYLVLYFAVNAVLNILRR